MGINLIAGIERAAHLIGVYVERTSRAVGITQAEAHVLARLARSGPTSIATLHREFGTKRSTLTNVLDRLEQRRLVRRELSSADRRSFTIHLTARGGTLARQVAKSLDTLEAAVRETVSERDARGVEAVLDAIDAGVRSNS